MDDGRPVHGQVSVRGPPLRFAPNPWMQPRLGNMGATPCQNVYVACTTSETMDGGPLAHASSGRQCILPLRLEARDHRPHRRLMLLQQAGMVERPCGAWTHTRPPQLQHNLRLVDWWTSWRSTWTGTNRSGADSVFALVAWELWKERNARCFRGTATQLQQLLAIRMTYGLFIFRYSSLRIF